MKPVALKRRGYYLMVSLWKNGKGTPQRVARLVYESFNEVDLPDSIDVHHRNTRRQDNWLENLEPLPDSEHNGHHDHNLRRGADHPHAVLTVDQVHEIRQLYRRGVRGSGYSVIGKMFGTDPSHIRDIIKGEDMGDD